MRMRYWFAIVCAVGWFVFAQMEAGHKGGIIDIKDQIALAFSMAVYAVFGFLLGWGLEKIWQVLGWAQMDWRGS